MFRAHVLIIRRSKLHYTASGIITPIGVMIQVLNILNMVYTQRFFLFKMQFHKSNVFGSCFIHILYTCCVKI